MHILNTYLLSKQIINKQKCNIILENVPTLNLYLYNNLVGFGILQSTIYTISFWTRFNNFKVETRDFTFERKGLYLF